MTNIREALDTYPLSSSLRRGHMDLRPSLARHLAKEIDIETPVREPDEEIEALVQGLFELRDQWRQLSDQLPAGDRSASLWECAQQINALMGEE